MKLAVDVKVVVTKNVDITYLKYEREENVIIRKLADKPCAITELINYKLPALVSENANTCCWQNACDFINDCLGETVAIDCNLDNGFYNGSDGRTRVDSKIVFLDRDCNKIPDVEFTFKTWAKAREIEKNIVPLRIRATTNGLVA